MLFCVRRALLHVPQHVDGFSEPDQKAPTRDQGHPERRPDVVSRAGDREQHEAADAGQESEAVGEVVHDGESCGRRESNCASEPSAQALRKREPGSGSATEPASKNWRRTKKPARAGQADFSNQYFTSHNSKIDPRGVKGFC